MSTIALQTSRLRLEVVPEAGASIAAWKAKVEGEWLSLLRPTPAEAIEALNPSLMSSFILAPWSNRIPGAQFEFEGRCYHLQATTPEGYAMHGDVRRRPWQVIDQQVDTLTCRLDSRAFPDFNYPFPLVCEVCYGLSGHTFSTTLTLTNVGETPMPAGFGFHPYFNRAFGDRGPEAAQLQLAVGGVYPPLPGGPMQPILPEQDFTQVTAIATRDIDACFGGWDGQATIAYPEAGVQIQLDCDQLLSHVIIFTPSDKPFFAVEPVTHATNGLNLMAQGQADTGIQVLQPGEAMSGQFEMHFKGLH